MKVLTRYLLRAHIGPFLFALVALTGIILINTLAKELSSLAGKGLPFSVVVEFFILSLPANVALTMPMAVLVAVLYTFSTLASDNEITALRSSGVDLRRASLPLVFVAGLITLLMIWFNDRVLPAANFRWRVLMTDVAQTSPLLALQAQRLNPIQAADGSTRYYLQAREIESGSGWMDEVRIYDIGTGGMIRTITADSGRVAFNSARTDLFMTLYDGEVWEVDFAEAGGFQLVDFERQVMRMEGVGEEFQRSYGSEYRTDRDMTIGMMRARIDSLRVEIANLRGPEPMDAPPADVTEPESAGEVAVAPSEVDGPPEALNGDPGGGAQAAEGAIDAASTPVDLATGTASLEDGIAAAAGASLGIAADSPAAQGDALPETADARDSVAATASTEGQNATAARSGPERVSQARINTLEFQIREYRLEIQKKFTIAFATLVFVLLGIPVALRFPRGGIGMVSVVSLAIFGIYYVGLIGGEELSDRGYVPVTLAMWTTNIIFGTLGLIGFLRLGREQGSGRGSGWGDLPRWLRLRPRSRGADS